MQGALPPAPPASPRNSRGATPCQAINFDIFRHIERECSQGFKGGDFRRKYYPSLDGTERHTALAEGKATRLSLLPHGECGVWGNAPRVKFRDGVRPPFSKGEEDWGLPPASEYRSRSAGGKAPFMNYIEVMRAYSSHFERLTRGNHHKWEQGRLSVSKGRKSVSVTSPDTLSDTPDTHENTLCCCPACGSIDVKKNGKTLAGVGRLRCKDCGKSFVDR